MNESETAAEAKRVAAFKPTDWLGLGPALIAAFLGAIYGIGAITYYGQLRDTGVNGVQSMTLVPLQQILGQGIGRMAQQFGLALLVFAMVVLVVFFLLPSPRPERNQGKLYRIQIALNKDVGPRWLKGVVIAIVLLVGLSTTPAKEALVYGIAIGVGVGVALALVRLVRLGDESTRERVRKHPVALIALLMLLILTSINIAKAFITPAPLPHVRLAMIDGTSLEGGFVAEAGSTWLIVQDNASIAAIEARQIRRSFITYPRSSPERSVLDWILGREPTKGFWGGPRKE